MIKILFICHGNICRSPMAEYIMKDLVRKRGLEDCFLIASAAVSSEEITARGGNPVYPPARAELERHGVFCGNHRATLLHREDYEKYDLIIGMDGMNMRAIARTLGSDPDGKIHRLGEFSGGSDVDDPWFTDRFDVAFRDIKSGCEALLAQLTGSQGRARSAQ